MSELPCLKETVEKYGLLAKKSLGQNFLLNMNITEKIIRDSLAARHKENFSGEEVIEVGPGPGGLTRAILAKQPRKLTVIEMDKRCLAAMDEIKAASEIPLEIINGDALRYNFGGQDGRIRSVVSNLPYNISVPLLVGWLKNMQCFESLTLMFQKEVAERIMAMPGGKSYGRISILARITAEIKHLFDLNPNCFVPAPKIWSSVLLFTPKTRQPDKRTLQNLEKITALAFGQRRKMIRQSLKSLPLLEEICMAADVAPTSRAENITPEQYLIMAQSF